MKHYRLRVMGPFWSTGCGTHMEAKEMPLKRVGYVACPNEIRGTVFSLLMLPSSKSQIAAVQAMSLTGALRLGATFLSRHPSHPPLKAIYIPTPTVEEDAWALKDAGLEIRLYRFYDRKTGMVDWEGMKDDLQAAPDKSIVLLHVSGSSPTGAEMTAVQWRLCVEIVKVSLRV